ncbi:MAG: hypothetical protein J6W75_12750 [Bacteroidaceae bacterium]|nr:hypothetical protein [Bacteroidaceae bacterium]
MIDDLDEDEDPNRYKLSGSTITSDMIGEMGGASKETIRGYFLRTAAEWSTGHYRY